MTEAADPAREQAARVVHRVLTEVLGLSPGLIRPEATLEGDLRLDSLGMVELFLAVEEACRVEISDQTAARIHTVADLVEAITPTR